MNGLSSTALQNTTSLAQPIEFSARVSSAVRLTIRPMSAIASMFNPARVEPTLADAQTRLVAASASGMAAKRLASTCVMPFSTFVEKPPMKSTSTACAARSSVSAMRTRSPRRGAAGNQRDRRHRDAVVDDREPKLLGDLSADAPQIAGDSLYFFVDVAAQAVATIADAIEQADADGDGADIELLRAHHLDGFEDLLAGEVEMSHLSVVLYGVGCTSAA